MNPDAVPGRTMFQVAIVMSALWIGANTLLLWKAYEVKRLVKPKLETSFSFVKIHTSPVKSQILL